MVGVTIVITLCWANFAHLAVGLIFLLVERRAARVPELHDAAILATLALMASAFAFGLARSVPVPVYAVPGNALAIAGIGLAARAIHVYLGERRSTLHYLGPALVWPLACLLPDFFGPEGLNLRGVVASALFTAAASVLLSACLPFNQGTKRALRPMALAALLLMAAVSVRLVAAVIALVTHDAGAEYIPLAIGASGMLVFTSAVPLLLLGLVREREAVARAARDAEIALSYMRDLEASEARLEQAQEVSGVATFEIDIATRMITLSQAGYAMLGLNPSPRLSYCDLEAMVTPATRHLMAPVAKGLDTDQWPSGTVAAEIDIVHPSKGIRHIRCVGRRILDRDGRSAFFLGTCQDVTEDRDSERRMLEVARLAQIGELSVGVAHELRQPLNAIKLALDNLRRSLQRQGHLDEATAARFARIDRNIGRSDRVIDALRKLGRAPSDARDVFDAGQAVGEVLALAADQARMAHIRLVTSIANGLNVFGEQGRLEQAVLNLVSNAMHAAGAFSPDSDHAPFVSIGVRGLGGSVEIVVADNGPGIPEEIRPRLFEAFATTKPPGEGTGLGLAIVHAVVVSEFGGTVTYETSAEGTAFTIRLPRVEAEASVA